MESGDRTALVLGGSGLVGFQVARKLAAGGEADRVVITALGHGETLAALNTLRQEFPEVPFDGYAGNLFLPGEPLPVDGAGAEPRVMDRGGPELRRRLFEDLYRDFESAYRDSLLAKLIRLVGPEVVVDCVNTATGISYQDVFSASQAVRAGLDDEEGTALRADMEKLLISLSIPQLILHTRILVRALTEAKSRLYLKVGTTGTGGMGLNIPYTHGEERPSPQLLNKTAVAFAHTGMLFLMGRTPGGPIIKEVKPAALIGYRGVEYREAFGRQYHRHEGGERVEYRLGNRPEPYMLYTPRRVTLGESLDLTPNPEGYVPATAPDGSATLKVPLVDTGENGLFTLGEFEAITSLDQMEYITPEEIAQIIVLEVRGAGTGKDMISAVDSAVLGSTYKAGLLRSSALKVLAELEREHEVPSIALGRLGPPDLAKHLFEAYLFQKVYGTLEAVRAAAATGPEAISARLFEYLSGAPLVASQAVSIGIPILCPDGKTLLRGPAIKAPAYRPYRTEAPLTPEHLEEYARTWVDLRPSRVRWWLDTFEALGKSRFVEEHLGWSTARVNRKTYLSDDIRIGNVIAWIFGNQGESFRVL